MYSVSYISITEVDVNQAKVRNRAFCGPFDHDRFTMAKRPREPPWRQDRPSEIGGADRERRRKSGLFEKMRRTKKSVRRIAIAL